MAEYFNAKEMLPAELVAEVLDYIPQRSRSGTLIYFSEDYYAKRNAEIARCFQIYQSDPKFGSQIEIYEALSAEYGLSTRHICKIVKGIRDRSSVRNRPRRRYSGIRVRRSSRNLSLRTVLH